MKKVILALAATAAATTAFAACGVMSGNVTIWIGGNGDVTGELESNCSQAQSPCTIEITSPGQEWVEATARAGSDFIAWDGCPEEHGQYCRLTYTEGMEDIEFAAMFAPQSAPRVTVQACTSGILPGSLCTPYVGKTFALIFEGDTFQAIGWDNRVYTGTYYENMFSGSAGGELMTAVDNGDGRISITLWPKGYSGCSSTVPNCVVSLRTVRQ